MERTYKLTIIEQIDGVSIKLGNYRYLILKNSEEFLKEIYAHWKIVELIEKGFIFNINPVYKCRVAEIYLNTRKYKKVKEYLDSIANKLTDV